MDQGLDAKIVRERFDEVTARINASYSDLPDKSPLEIADGFLRIAVDHMALAVKEITMRRGIAVDDATLCSFGGAGGQHACLVADALGMKTIFMHQFSGVLSAYVTVCILELFEGGLCGT
jgi:5-oxoprolinase (ATP-hydrolysing)